jgi:hypothetical protein
MWRRRGEAEAPSTRRKDKVGAGSRILLLGGACETVAGGGGNASCGKERNVGGPFKLYIFADKGGIQLVGTILARFGGTYPIILGSKSQKR